MTHEERILAACRGERADRIPWVPRLDLWYRANQRADTLPPKYRTASLSDIVDDLGTGLHAVVPDFRDLRGPEDDVDRALGIYNLSAMPCRTEHENVQRKTRVEGDRSFVGYETPLGPITTAALYNETMRRAGISITHVEKHAFATPDDYGPLGYLFENARVLPNYAGYAHFAEQVAALGVAVAGQMSSITNKMPDIVP